MGFRLERKHSTWLLASTLLLAAAVIMASLWAVREREEEGTPKVLGPAATGSEHRVRIKGFRYSGYHEGRKVLGIEADAFTVEKARLGHFRLSLFNVARLRNARIDLYGTEAPSAPRDRARAQGTPIGNLQPGGVSFSRAFTGEALPSFGVERVARITIEPVTVRLFNEDELLTRLSASSATIDPRSRNIRFRGHVHARSGARELETEELEVDPNFGILSVRGPYELRLETGRTLNGQDLQCDSTLRTTAPGGRHGTGKWDAWGPRSGPHGRPPPPSPPTP